MNPNNREIIIKRKPLKFIGHCLTIGLIVVLTMIIGACSSASMSTTIFKSATTSPSITISTTETIPGFSSIEIRPFFPDNLTVGSTQAFTAIGIFPDYSQLDITSQVTWDSDNPGVATISPNGLATGMAVGTANITAILSALTSPPVSLTVVAAPSITPTSQGKTSTVTLSSIAITPNPPLTSTVNSIQEFTATGTYSDGSKKDITYKVTRACDNPNVATVDSSGLAACLSTGTAHITATLSGIISQYVTLIVVSS